MADDFEYSDAPGQHGTNFNAPYGQVVLAGRRRRVDPGTIGAIRDTIRRARLNRLRQERNAPQERDFNEAVNDVAGPPPSAISRYANQGQAGLREGMVDNAVLGMRTNPVFTLMPGFEEFTRAVANRVGITDDTVQPNTTGERYMHEGARFIGGALVPEAMLARLGSRVAARVAEGVAVNTLSRVERMSLDYVRHPIRSAAANVTGALGTVGGGDAASLIDERLRPVGQIVGGLAGGMTPFAGMRSGPRGTANPRLEEALTEAENIVPQDEVHGVSRTIDQISDEPALSPSSLSPRPEDLDPLPPGPRREPEQPSAPVRNDFRRMTATEEEEMGLDGSNAETFHNPQTGEMVVLDHHPNEPVSSFVYDDPTTSQRVSGYVNHDTGEFRYPNPDHDIDITPVESAVRQSLRNGLYRRNSSAAAKAKIENDISNSNPLIWDPEADNGNGSFVEARHDPLPEKYPEDTFHTDNSGTPEAPLPPRLPEDTPRIDRDANEGGGEVPPGGNGNDNGHGGGEPPRPPEEPPEPPPEPRRPDKAGNVNLDNLLTTDEVKDTLRTHVPEEGTDAQTHAETLARAEELLDQHGPEGLINLREMPLEDAPAYSAAIRAVNESAANRLTELSAAHLNPERNTSAVELAFDKAKLLSAAAFERTSGIAGVAGRLLNAHKIRIGEGTLSQTAREAIDEAIENGLDRTELAKLIQTHANDPAAVSRLASESLKPNASDYIFSSWYNLILSDPRTQERNILGNLLNLGQDLTAHGVGAVLGQRHRLTGNTAERIAMREATARIWGSMASVGTAFRNAGRAFNLGVPLDMQGRGVHGRVYKGRWTGALEAFTRGLAAGDEFFRTVATMSDMHGMAVRRAVKEGLTGDAFHVRVEELLESPTKEMSTHAREYALRMRFQDPPGLIARAVNVMTHINKTDTWPQIITKAALRMAAFTFVRTPSSIVRTMYRYSPVGILESKNLRDIRAGGAERDLALSRIATGTAVMGYFASKVASGDVTGEGPGDPNRRAQWLAGGHQPNSIKINGLWRSYNGFGPMAVMLSAVATSAERLHELPDDASRSEQIGRVALGVADAMVDNSWMSNVSNLFKVISGSEGERGPAFQNMVANQAASVVPAALRAVTQEYVDTTVRDTRGDGVVDTSINRVMAEIPGLSDNLPARHDTGGNEIHREDEEGPDILNPFTQRTPRTGPVIDEIERLSQNGGQTLLTAPGRNVNVNDERRTLNAEEYQRYQELSGTRAMAEMARFIATPEYGRMSDDDRREELHTIVSEVREDVRDELFNPPTPAARDDFSYSDSDTPAAPASSPPTTDDFSYSDSGPPSSRPGRPVASAASVVEELFPGVRVTQEHRDPNSRLGRANPDSWHNFGRAAVDVHPIRGMTFDEYIQTIRDAGYTIIQKRDEVLHPSRWATGPHWHVVIGERS